MAAGLLPGPDHRIRRAVATEWNSKESAAGHCGSVTAFDIDDGFVSRYPVQQLGGGPTFRELWVPAGELGEFNAHIVGPIRVAERVYGPGFTGELDPETRLPMSVTNAERESLLRRAYATFNARDIDGALATMRPDVEWPNAMEGGIVVGHDGIRAYWTRQWGEFDPRVEPVGFEHSGDETAVDVRQVVRDRAGSVLMDVRVRHVYRFHDGLVARMTIPESASPKPWAGSDDPVR